MSNDHSNTYPGRLAGLAMVLAPLVFVSAELLHARLDRDAGTYLDRIAMNPDRWYAAHMLVLLGLALVVPALAATVQLFRGRSPRLASASVVLLLPAVVALAALVGMELVAWQLAQSTITRSELITVWENTAENGAIAPLVGIALLLPVAWLLAGIGLYRARVLPRWSAALIGVAQLVGFAGELSGAPKWVAVAAQLAFAAGLAPLGLRLLTSRAPAPGAAVDPQTRAVTASR